MYTLEQAQIEASLVAVQASTIKFEGDAYPTSEDYRAAEAIVETQIIALPAIMERTIELSG